MSWLEAFGLFLLLWFLAAIPVGLLAGRALAKAHEFTDAAE